MERYGIEELFPDYLRYLWKEVIRIESKLQEIRLRVNQPVIMRIENQEFFLHKTGKIIYENSDSYQTTEKDMHQILNYLCNYSIYAYEDEMRQGFFTVPGGHRIGITGQVIQDADQIRNLKYISSLNIRIAHEIKGAADKAIPYLYHQKELYNTMIISNPGCGKTTILRDLIRQISNGNRYGNGRNVGVVDERSEIAGSFQGIPQNDIGIRTDVLDACPKVQGMMMLIRSMSPRVIAVDEIGSLEDIRALKTAMQCGCNMIVTVHAASFEEVKQKEWFCEMFCVQMFERFIEMGKAKQSCLIQHIYDAEGKELCREL